MSQAKHTAWLADRPVARAEVAALARELSLSLVEDPAWTFGIRQSRWEKEGVRLTFIADALSGSGLFVVSEPDGMVAERVVGRFGGKGPDEVVAQARSITRPLDVMRAVHRVSALLLPGGPPDEQVLAYLCEKLMDEAPLVRWSACRLLQWNTHPSVVRGFEGAAQRYPEFRDVARSVLEQFQAAEEGTLGDTPTNDWYELVSRARAGMADGKWKRVERATEMLLADRLDHGEGLLLRALAYEAAGDPLLALGLLGASVGVQKMDRDTRPEGEPADEAEALEEETQSIRARLEHSVASLPRELVLDTSRILAWLERFRDDQRSTPEAGMARILVDPLPDLSVLLCYVAGKYSSELELLERAVQGAPDSPECLTALAHAIETSDPQRGESLCMRALELSNASEPESASARQVRAHAGKDASILRAEALSSLADMAYERQDWDRAGRFADDLVALAPGNATGWQIRANSRTFALQHEEAIPLYLEAIEALDRMYDSRENVYFGADPRPGMHFNLSCVLSKVDRRRESLEHLRRAIRKDEKYSQMAVEDDYYGDLLRDPEFLSIVAREPRALILEEERSPDFVLGLVDRAIGLDHRGETNEALEASERAVQLAESLEDVELLVRALLTRGRILAFRVDPGPGVEMLDRAVRLAESGEVKDEVRADALHTYGVTLHACGQGERAEAAYRQAHELRRRVHGDDHPLVAKSLGDIARLVGGMGRAEEARSLICEGIALLERYVDGSDSSGGDEDDRAEALVDLATLLANLSLMTEAGGDVGEAIERLNSAAQALERVYESGYTAGNLLLEFVRDRADQLVRVAQSEAQSVVAREVAAKLSQLGLSDDAAVREEQIFWRNLRRFASRMKREGVTDARLAEVFLDALRGEPLPEALLSVPEIGGLAKALAERAARDTTFIVLAPMALETARVDGNIDHALASLEDLCIGSLRSGEEENY